MVSQRAGWSQLAVRSHNMQGGLAACRVVSQLAVWSHSVQGGLNFHGGLIARQMVSLHSLGGVTAMTKLIAALRSIIQDFTCTSISLCRGLLTYGHISGLVYQLDPHQFLGLPVSLVHINVLVYQLVPRPKSWSTSLEPINVLVYQLGPYQCFGYQLETCQCPGLLACTPILICFDPPAWTISMSWYTSLDHINHHVSLFTSLEHINVLAH